MVTTNNLHIKVMHMELRDHPQPTEWHPYELAVTVSITNKGEGSASLADRHFMFDGGMGVRKAHSGLEMIEPQSERVVTLLFATEQSMDPQYLVHKRDRMGLSLFLVGLLSTMMRMMMCTLLDWNLL